MLSPSSLLNSALWLLSPSSVSGALQEDVECEYGYEWLDGECKPIVGLDRQQCGVLNGQYVESVTRLRLVHGDTCKNVSRVILDTDGRGHLTVPDSGRPLRHSVLAAIFGATVVCAAHCSYRPAFEKGKHAVHASHVPCEAVGVCVWMWVGACACVCVERRQEERGR